MELGFRLSAEPSVRQIQRFNAWQLPQLPSLDPRSLRRWAGSPTWTPPDTQPLVRHRSHDGTRRIVTNDRNPPRGFAIEYDLGLVHRFAQPGTARLLAFQSAEDSPQRYLHTRAEGELDAGYAALGYMDSAPLPMLDSLELRRDPATGAEVLVAGASDPLYNTAGEGRILGFVEGFPIQPRLPPDRRVARGTQLLLRSADELRWRHRYGGASQRDQGDVVLGGLWTQAGPPFVALYRTAGGWLGSELLPEPKPARPRLAARARWVAAPLGWTQRRPRVWALRASASRARRLLSGARSKPDDAGAPAPDQSLLGYVRRAPAHGWSAIFSAWHPALEDQYVTRSELEAGDMGYTIQGILGYVLDWPADRTRDSLPAEVKWTSRFGHRRRYVEGAMPGGASAPRERG